MIDFFATFRGLAVSFKLGSIESVLLPDLGSDKPSAERKPYLCPLETEDSLPLFDEGE